MVNAGAIKGNVDVMLSNVGSTMTVIPKITSRDKWGSNTTVSGESFDTLAATDQYLSFNKEVLPEGLLNRASKLLITKGDVVIGPDDSVLFNNRVYSVLSVQKYPLTGVPLAKQLVLAEKSVTPFLERFEGVLDLYLDFDNFVSLQAQDVIGTNNANLWYTGNNAGDGLMGYWPMNGNANDQTYNAVNGTVSGATLTTDHLGNADGAYEFNGSTDYIDFTDHARLESFTKVTMGCWIYLNTLPESGSRSIFSKSQAGIPGTGYNLMIGYPTSGIVHAEFRSTVANKSVNSDSDIITGEWHRLILTFDGYTAKIYIDGVLAGTGATTASEANIVNDLPFRIGAGQEHVTNAIDGKISEAFVHKGYAWLASEVLDDYNAGLLRKWSDPVDSVNKGIIVNGLTQYALTDPVTISRAGGALAWKVDITQEMIDGGFVLFGNSWKNGQSHVVFNYQGGNTLIYYETNSNGNGRQWYLPEGFVPGTYNFVMSWDDSVCTLYLDGVSQGVGVQMGTGIIDDLIVTLIGNQAYGYNYGDICNTEYYDVMIFNTPLTSSDVLAIMNK